MAWHQWALTEEVRKLLDHMMDGFALHELLYDGEGRAVDYRFLLINRAAEKILGVDEGNVLGRRVRELLPVVEDHWVQTFARVAETGEPVRFEQYSGALDRWFEVVAWRAGQRQFACQFRDVTDQRLAREKLEFRLRLGRALAELNQLLAGAHSPERYVEEACRMLVDHGRLGATSVHLRSGDTVVKARRGMELCRRCPHIDDRSGRIAHAPGQGQLATGDIPPAEPQGPCCIIGGQDQCFIFPAGSEGSARVQICVPIGDRKLWGEEEIRLLQEAAEDVVAGWRRLAAEERLRQLNRQLQEERSLMETLFDASPSALVLCRSTDGTVLKVNREFLRQAELGADESAGRTLADLGCFDPEEMEEILSQARQLGRLSRRELACAGRQGGRRWWQVEGVMVESGGQSCLLLAGRDVTAEKDAERERARLAEIEARMQRLESLGRLAGGISHDFNNLLTIIGGYADLLMAQAGRDHPWRPLLERLKQGVERARQVTEGLRALGRDTGPRNAHVHPNEALRDDLTLFRRLLREDIEVETRFDETVESVPISRAELSQIVVNLLLNAQDAMPDGGKIELSTRVVALDGGDRRFRLECADTGEGMSEGVRLRIFEPFFTTRDGRGSGMGLAVVHAIVQRAGGRIWADSEPGRGARFVVELPHEKRDPSAEAEFSHPGSIGQQLAGRRILIVEDDAGVRQLVGEILRAAGCEVVEASRPSEALLHLDGTGRLDALVTDLVMPEMTGRDLMARVEKQHPGLPVVLMSGYSGSSGQLSDHSGRIVYLEKPFSPEDLLDRLAELLAGT